MNIEITVNHGVAVDIAKRDPGADEPVVVLIVNADTQVDVTTREPVPVDCVLSDWSLDSYSDWGACLPNGTQERVEVWTRAVLTEPVNGGAVCGPLSETRVGTQPCVYEQPMQMQMFSRPLSGPRIQFRTWGSGRYVRYVRNTFMPPRDTITMVRQDGVANLGYTLLVLEAGDGPPVAVARAVATSPASVYVNFTVDLSAFPAGWHLLDLLPDAGNEVCHPAWVYLEKTPGEYPVGDFAPVITGSYGIGHEDGPTARWGKMPLSIDPPTFTMEQRTAVPFSDVPAPKDLYRRQLSPCINGDPVYLRTLDNGVKTCMNSQGYAFTTLQSKLPGVVLRDGPFGVGTMVGPMHLQVGRRGGVYFADSWRFGQVGTDGTIRTLAGYRHTDDGLELVGDWSAIPAERRGFLELWGAAWDERTVSAANLDTTLTLDRGDGVMEHPHQIGPVAYLPDSQNNRIVSLMFDPRSHDKPPVVREFAVGINDPWDCVSNGNGVLYVSERQSHRICAYDMDTGAMLRVVMQGQAYATVDKNRKVHRSVALADIRLEPCVAPEGLFWQDGWLYFAALANGQVKRWNEVTGEIQVCASWEPPAKSEFCKLTLSDGTFMPRGTMFVAAWGTGGLPLIFLPDGTRTRVNVQGSASLPGGLGGEWSELGYATACAVGQGRLVYGGADYGLAEITLGQPGDVKLDEDKYVAGKRQYGYAGYRLTHGIDGFGQWQLPLPWGQTAEMDYFLSCHGHKPSIIPPFG